MVRTRKKCDMKRYAYTFGFDLDGAHEHFDLDLPGLGLFRRGTVPLPGKVGGGGGDCLRGGKDG